MIESILAFMITLAALGWVFGRIWRYKPKNRTRLAIVIILMVAVAYAVEAYIPDSYGYRVQLWFGVMTAILMAVATYVETEPKEG
jgi:hypothetical protein